MFKTLLEKPLVAKLWQFAKFAIVGLSNTLISLAVYEILIHLGMHYIPADGIGLVVSVVNAYYWNNRVVFGDGEKKPFSQHVRGYFKSLASYGGTFVLNALLLTLWVEVVGIPAWLAPFVNMAITIPINFWVNKYWTFGKKK